LNILYNILQVLLRGPDNEAYGVEYQRHGVTNVALASKEVIVSAGAIQSPQILMLSGIGPREHLESLNVRCDSFVDSWFFSIR